nr:MAG TPA: hypothetical protein [Inoviridae sp.]
MTSEGVATDINITSFYSILINGIYQELIYR